MLETIFSIIEKQGASIGLLCYMLFRDYKFQSKQTESLIKIDFRLSQLERKKG